MSILTQILLGTAIVAGVLAFLFFIESKQDKHKEILEKMNKDLIDLNAKLEKLVENNESKQDKHKSD